MSTASNRGVENVGIHISVMGGATTVEEIRKLEEATRRVAMQTRSAIDMNGRAARAMKDGGAAMAGASESAGLLSSRMLSLGRSLSSVGPGFGGATGQILEFSSVALNAKKVMEEQSGSLAELGTLIRTNSAEFSLFGDAVQGVGASFKSIALGGLAIGGTFAAMKIIVEPLLKQWNDLSGYAAKLNREFDAMYSRVDAIAKAYQISGKHVKTYAEAQAIIMADARRVPDAFHALGEGLAVVNREFDNQERAILAVSQSIESLTDQQRVALADSITKLEGEEKAYNRTLDESVASIRTKILADKDLDGSGTALKLRAQELRIAEEALIEKRILHKKLCDELAARTDAGSEAYKRQVDAVFDLQTEMGDLAEQINRGFDPRPIETYSHAIKQMTEEAKKAASGVGMISSENFELFRISDAQGAAIEADTKKFLEQQAKGFKEYDEAIEAHHKDAVDKMAAYMVKTFGVANVAWSNQFNDAVMGIVGSAEGAWNAAANSAFGGKKSNDAPDMTTGSGRASAAISGLKGTPAEQAQQLAKMIAQAEGSQKALRREVMPGRFANTPEMRIRDEQIAEMKRELNRITGGKDSLQDKFRDKFSAIGKEVNPWEEKLDKLVKVQEETKEEIKRASAFGAAKTDTLIAETRGMHSEVRRSADAAVKTASAWGRASAASSLPDAAAPQPGRVSRGFGRR